VNQSWPPRVYAAGGGELSVSSLAWQRAMRILRPGSEERRRLLAEIEQLRAGQQDNQDRLELAEATLAARGILPPCDPPPPALADAVGRRTSNGQLVAVTAGGTDMVTSVTPDGGDAGAFWEYIQRNAGVIAGAGR
jgi:hypothetical protein